MLPSEAYQLQLGVKNRSCNSSTAQLKDNPFQNHQLFRQACHQNKALYLKDFRVPFSDSFDFSKNGDFLVAGVNDGVKVGLWRTAHFLGITNEPKPTLIMDFKHGHNLDLPIRNITTSSDDTRIISNNMSAIAIHDIQR